jgi:hypothetical protein
VLNRKVANEAAVRQYFAAWDPLWRWALVLALRDARTHPDRLADLASDRVGTEELRTDEYAFGPLALGLTAAAVNETAQYAEDLFALLSFIREQTHFVKRMTSYAAGKVIQSGQTLATASDERIRGLFMVPDDQIITAGLAGADDPAAATAAANGGIVRLIEMTRAIADWYLTHEFFHLQYKHGLKLPLTPFGTLPADTIERRRCNVNAPLIAFTNEPLAKTLARPPGQQSVMIPALDAAVAPHLVELLNEGNLLRYQMNGQDTNLDDVIDVAWTISRLLRVARDNRLALINGLDGQQHQNFALPGAKPAETLQVALQLTQPVTLAAFQSLPRR